MCKNILDILTERIFEFGPIVTRKLFKFDIQSEGMRPMNQMMVLGTLHEEGSLPVSEICKKNYISKPQMTAIIDKLIKEELVERFHNKEDRRIINISLTDKGKEYASCVKETLRSNMKNKLLCLSNENKIKLLNSIETAINILKSME
ncbi:MarR family winged helix-turn-helix transcriptional regulator [Clostridium sp. DJ247]|uniref:MarR family winged helix-turn-helix transcriptional regulator n=1 Tax=Clostridium sp. DJ247 TaxID=2726188 RepID=UPI001625753F|nr:MarR family transcriptional regulator [Clostridium sp. DJ247]MBC2580759.1 MarR family transcriptional regulator [Clostridium sp. DJ247]